MGCQQVKSNRNLPPPLLSLPPSLPPPPFSSFSGCRGITLVSLSVVCDAVLPNLQERLFAEGSSRLEGR